VIIAFERGRERDTFQNIAFGAVTRFVSLLVAGLILELVAGGGDLDGVCLKRFEPCELNEFASSVPEWWLLISWFVISCGFALTDLFFFQKKFPRHFLDKISNMVTVTVDEIQEDLAGYLCRVEAGETVVIVRADKPFAEIKPVGSDCRAPRPAGLCTGEFVVPDDFDKSLPEDVLRQFEGKKGSYWIPTFSCGSLAATNACRLPRGTMFAIPATRPT
jgi:antitoxin (DNA-binding transcriptional repressor) of toxin-antitoxin stability system